jgi:hypothetical protein
LTQHFFTSKCPWRTAWATQFCLSPEALNGPAKAQQLVCLSMSQYSKNWSNYQVLTSAKTSCRHGAPDQLCDFQWLTCGQLLQGWAPWLPFSAVFGGLDKTLTCSKESPERT